MHPRKSKRFELRSGGPLLLLEEAPLVALLHALALLAVQVVDRHPEETFKFLTQCLPPSLPTRRNLQFPYSMAPAQPHYTKKKSNSLQPLLFENIELNRGDLLLCGDPNFGEVSFSLSCSYEMRETFNLGLTLIHSFEYAEAEKAFVSILDLSLIHI